MQARNEVMLAGSQYAKRTVIGDTSVINNFTHNELRSYYKKWYRPDLQAILVVGDVDVDLMEAKIRKLFSTIPAAENPAERVWYQVPDNEKPIVGVFTDPEMTNQQMLVFWKRQALPNELRSSVQGYALSRVNDLISAMTNERLSNITQEPNSPFGGAAAGLSDLVRTSDAYLFQCSPVMGKEKEARVRLLKEIEVIRRFGFTESELERAKTAMLSNFEKSYKEKDQQKNTRLVQEYVRNFTSAEPIPGITWEYEFIKQLTPSVTLETVNALAKSYLPEKNMVFTITGPQKSGLTYPTNDELLQEIDAARKAEVQAYKDSVSNEPLIAKLPKSGKVKKERKNTEFGTTEWTLSNGIKVVFKSTKFKDDEINMNAWSEGGLSLVPTKDLMSAALAPDVIEYSGLGTFSATELQKKLTGKLVSINPSFGNYEETLSGNSSVKDQETLLQLAYLYFTAPRKDANAFDLLMKQIKTYLENAEKNPQKIYGDSVSMISSNYSPRVASTLINSENIKSIDMETVYRIYSERFSNPADFNFIFVGNIDPATFKPLVEKYLGSLKTKKSKETWKDDAIRLPKGLIRKDIVQKLQVSKSTNNIIYWAEMPFSVANNVTLKALADILDLRYTATLREAEGATYGVSIGANSGLRPIQTVNLKIRFDTDPKVEEKMLGIIHAELDTIAQRGPQPDDLNKVKLNLKKQHLEDVAENGWWMSVINRYYRDNINNLKEFDAAVESLSVESIRELTKNLLKPKNRLEILLQPE